MGRQTLIAHSDPYDAHFTATSAELASHLIMTLQGYFTVHAFENRYLLTKKNHLSEFELSITILRRTTKKRIFGPRKRKII
jgi:hypothetical protein